MVARLRSDIQVAALQRQADAEGLIYTVLNKGHAEGGMIFVKWIEGREATLFAECQADGVRGWRRLAADPVPEADADKRLEQERSFDPDLWVVELIGPARYQEQLLSPILTV